MSNTNPHPSAQNIKVAVDAAIFTVVQGELRVLAIQMKKEPFTGRWALPGGLIGDDESSEAAVRRVLAAETGVTDIYLEQYGVFDEPRRDPFGRVVSVAYFALLPSGGLELRTSEKYMAVRWARLEEMKGLAYDHDTVLSDAVAKVRARLGHSNVAWSLLPPVFTLAALQETYEAILGQRFDKRNFRKKILSTGVLEATGERQTGTAHRPAELYRFVERRGALVAA